MAPGVASPRLSSVQEDVFLRAVKYVLSEWPSLNFAIENGMGGSEAKQKQVWMCEHVAEIMIKGQDIDLDEYLAEIVNQEFDTLIEDGSLEYNVKWIEKFYKDCLQGKEQQVVDSIEQAATKKHGLIMPPPVKIQESDGDDDDEDDDDEADM